MQFLQRLFFFLLCYQFFSLLQMKLVKTKLFLNCFFLNVLLIFLHLLPYLLRYFEDWLLNTFLLLLHILVVQIRYLQVHHACLFQVPLFFHNRLTSFLHFLYNLLFLFLFLLKSCILIVSFSCHLLN